EGGDLEAIVDGILNEAVRPCPDGVVANLRTSAGRHDWLSEVDRKRCERLLKREHNGIAVSRIHRLNFVVSTSFQRYESGIEKGPERVNDVGRRQLVAVVELHAASQGDHV